MQALSEIYRLNAKETFAPLTENGRAGMMKEAAHKHFQEGTHGSSLHEPVHPQLKGTGGLSAELASVQLFITQQTMAHPYRSLSNCIAPGQRISNRGTSTHFR